MDEVSESKSLAEYVSGINRQKYKLLISIVIVFSIAAAVAFLLPPEYESKATILIEQQAIPTEFVKSTVTSYAEQRIQVISQRAMTRDNLYKIIEKYDLYTEDRKKDPIEEIIETMREDITIDTVNAQVVDPASGRVKAATIAFTISYKNDSPVLAQKVANELVSLYLNENIKNRTQKALETSGFLSDEAEKLNKRIQELEDNLAKFKEQNAGNLPEMVTMNMQMLERTEREINDTERDIYLLKEKKLYLKSQLAQVDPYIFTDNASGIMTPEKQVKQLQSRKIALESLYRDDHPDLKRVKKQLSVLQIEVEEDPGVLKEKLTESRAKYQKLLQTYSTEHPDAKRVENEISQLEGLVNNGVTKSSQDVLDLEPDNPLYIQLKTQLDTLELEEEIFLQKKDDLLEKQATYEERLLHSPQVEREFRSLSRNYENAWVKYRDLKAKQLEAQIAEALELDRKAERFTLIEPPLSPLRPKSPNRLMIISVGLFFSVFVGFGIAIFFDVMDKAIYSERQLLAAVGAPPLSVIPVIQTKRDKWISGIKVAGLYSGGIVVMTSVLFAINEWYKPLDVLWFVLMQKLDVM